MGALENSVDRFLKGYLEENTLEDLLEEHDLTVTEVVVHLFRSGMIDLEQNLKEQEEF